MIVIDLSTSEKMKAANDAIEANAAQRLGLPRVVEETEHYQITDYGPNHRAIHQEYRYGLSQKHAFWKDTVPVNAQADRLEALLPALMNAEAFHMEQLRWKALAAPKGRKQ